MYRIIKGKPVADDISFKLNFEVDNLKSKNITPKLTIVRVGENGSDSAYQKGAIKRCNNIGIEIEIKRFPQSTSQKDFMNELEKINMDDNVNGIMIFRPLPKHIDENEIKYLIDPKKDVDCFNPVNMSKILENDNLGFAPCTAAAVMEILKYYKIEVQGKRVVVIGRSMVVGKPLSLLLLNANATVTICHSKTEKMKEICSEADILVVCIGKCNMIDSSYIKQGAVVVDVGINVDKDGNLCGDVNTKNCIEKARMITPVPGGVGSVTTSVLAKQVITACKTQHNL
ncbi:bifunctional 5,10-methylenetetrahydrofolate dehydrogenase/5,10-methenyltetrahydrofolate cyclohydrolase [Clostridium sp. LBM24168]